MDIHIDSLTLIYCLRFGFYCYFLTCIKPKLKEPLYKRKLLCEMYFKAPLTETKCHQTYLMAFLLVSIRKLCPDNFKGRLLKPNVDNSIGPHHSGVSKTDL